VITAREQVPDLVKYELQEKIGLGGMATVYRARDKRLGRDVAVKLIHAHLRENSEVAVRFVSEARAVARLRHPNVVEVYDVSDENEPERYLVVELVRGTTLRALVSKHKKLPAELTAAIGLEVAAALSHAHQQGIIHRDVKPENVLIELATPNSSPAPTSDRPDRPRVKLTDFGIAKLLDAQGVTSTGQVLGSPAHMAPEQIEGGDVGARADVFALGVMLYECMVGRLPFDGKNPAQVLRRVLEGSYPPAVREEPKVGARFGDALAHALVREASGRYE
jgi:eukaryotic-like serine/threonine-protein kinase